MAPEKQIRAKLRKLAGTAYQRELDQELRGLSAWFTRWEASEVDCFELSDKIHEFHDGAARRLYVMYERLKPNVAVGRAIALGLLSSEETPPVILAKLKDTIELFRDQTEAS